MSQPAARPSVLITGSATRIGAEIARGFGREGWHVVIHHLNSGEEAEALAAELPYAETVSCDLADDRASVAMIERLAAQFDDWRCLINSAAIFRYDDATNCDPDTNREAMQVNALTPALMTQSYFAAAKSSGLRTAIQITDMKLENPNPDFFSYTMSKHAASSTVTMLAQAAKASGGQRDRVYGLAPGAILASHDQHEEETEISHRLNLLGRKTAATEIVDAALFLASGVLESGSSLFVDSGQHLLNQSRDVIYLAREQAAQ